MHLVTLAGLLVTLPRSLVTLCCTICVTELVSSILVAGTDSFGSRTVRSLGVDAAGAVAAAVPAVPAAAAPVEGCAALVPSVTAGLAVVHVECGDAVVDSRDSIARLVSLLV